MPSIDLIIKEFEKRKLQEKDKPQNLGVVYTPLEIAKYMVFNVFRIYFENFNDSNKGIESEISNIRILDPACGSGRFLVAIADYLFKINKYLNTSLDDFDLRKRIIQKNLYGIDIEKNACNISKLRLLSWLKPDYDIKNENFTNILDHSDINFNIFNEDYLINFQSKGFDIIIGNPPYIENKKITKNSFKSNISKKFKSAYKLFDMSVIFIEKSIILLKPEGCLSFLTTNKFLSADYGVKIREILLERTQIKEIVNISSLHAFQNASAYPIILFLKKEKENSNLISIKEFGEIDDIREGRYRRVSEFSQKSVYNFPSRVIPLSENVELLNKLYSKFRTLSETFKDLRIIYRPYGFIDWVNKSKYIKPKQTSPKDLLLLGTGNVGRYFIDFNKPIRVAQKRYQRPYYEYYEDSKEIWKEISNEKLIFREIAKDLTFVYDPGVFTNLTGLYFLRIPSFNTDQLFSLLTILNSTLVNKVFKSLYGTLHMSGGYLRINGSFIKRIPVPNNLPINLSKLGKILHFLIQLKFELLQNTNEIIQLSIVKNYINFYDKIANSIVNGLYLSDNQGSIKINNLPIIDFKFVNSYYEYSQFESYNDEELVRNFEKLKEFYNEFDLRKLNKIQN